MGFHWAELVIVTLVALLIFGPKRLPQMGSAIGKSYREFKKSLSEISESIQTNAEHAGARKENINDNF